MILNGFEVYLTSGGTRLLELQADEDTPTVKNTAVCGIGDPAGQVRLDC